MARPPRRPVSPGDRRVVAIFIATGVVISAIAFAITFWPRDEDETPTPTPAPTVAATATAPPPSPTPAEAAIFAAPCPDACLIRLVDDEPSRNALTERGLTPTFASGGAIWTGADSAAIDDLRGGGMRVAVLSDAIETLTLYSIRANSEDEEELVRAAGDIVDRVGNQYLVQVPKVPPPVRALTDAGIWIEKFPPISAGQVTDSAEQDDPVPLTDDLLTDLVWSVDQDRLYESIIDLQSMSSSDGSGVGTRHYTSTGNVMAAEYIYTTLAGYGLDVWYEDFITYDGLLALNVVAELPGNDPSAVYLVLGHFDSLNPADLSSSPGADDNATGIAAMLEIARLLSGYELAHPVRFFATNVEEVDLQGVKAFAANAAAEEVPIAGAFNVDALGSAAHGSQIVFNTDEAGVWLEDLMIRVNDQYGLGQDILAKVNPIIVADDNFLRDYGYPTVLVARELFGWSTLHHTIDDTVETVDLYNVRMAAALVLGAVANLVVT